MMTANEVRKLAERLGKAEALVESGAVYPVAGLDGYAVVRNGDGTQMYLARCEAGKEHCTCPDFQHRQSKAQQACKHLYAAQLFNERSEDKAGAEVPATDDGLVKADEIRRLKGRRSRALLNGDDEAIDAIDAQLASHSVAA